MIEKIGGRKFILSVVVLVAGVVFFAIGRIDYSQFLDVARWILGMYIIGNTVTYGLSRAANG